MSSSRPRPCHHTIWRCMCLPNKYSSGTRARNLWKNIMPPHNLDRMSFLLFGGEKWKKKSSNFCTVICRAGRVASTFNERKHAERLASPRRIIDWLLLVLRISSPPYYIFPNLFFDTTCTPYALRTWVTWHVLFPSEWYPYSVPVGAPQPNTKTHLEGEKKKERKNSIALIS